MADYRYLYSPDDSLRRFTARQDVRDFLNAFAAEADAQPTIQVGWTVLGYDLVRKVGDASHVPRYQGTEAVIMDLQSHPLAQYPHECFPSSYELGGSLVHPLRVFSRNVLYFRIPEPWPQDVRSPIKGFAFDGSPTFFIWQWSPRSPERFEHQVRRFIEGEDHFRAHFQEFITGMLEQRRSFLTWGRAYLRRVYGCIDMRLLQLPRVDARFMPVSAAS